MPHLSCQRCQIAMTGHIIYANVLSLTHTVGLLSAVKNYECLEYVCLVKTWKKLHEVTKWQDCDSDLHVNDDSHCTLLFTAVIWGNTLRCEFWNAVVSFIQKNIPLPPSPTHPPGRGYHSTVESDEDVLSHRLNSVCHRYQIAVAGHICVYRGYCGN
jgi:hypothetical protein